MTPLIEISDNFHEQLCSEMDRLIMDQRWALTLPHLSSELRAEHSERLAAAKVIRAHYTNFEG